jgi:hypothetical protein
MTKTADTSYTLTDGELVIAIENFMKKYLNINADEIHNIEDDISGGGLPEITVTITTKSTEINPFGEDSNG